MDNTKAIIRAQWVIIFLLLVGFAWVLYKLYEKGESKQNFTATDSARPPLFRYPVSDSTALADTNKFSMLIPGAIRPKPKGVVYDIQSIRDYVMAGGIFDQLVTRHQAHMATTSTTLPPGHSWGVAFYLMRKDNLSKNGIGFFTVPVIYNTTTYSVLDYFNAANARYYARAVQGSPTTYNAYDEGHLWP